MKRLYFLVLIILFSCVNFVYAQANISEKDSLSRFIKKNNLHIELGGVCGLGSVNYERLLITGKTGSFHIRIGALPILGFRGDYTIVGSVSGTGLFGKNKSKLLLGTAISLWYRINPSTNVSGDNQSFSNVISPIFWGYHYQSDQGFIFRITLNPLLPSSNRYRIFPWAAISIGHSF